MICCFRLEAHGMAPRNTLHAYVRSLSVDNIDWLANSNILLALYFSLVIIIRNGCINWWISRHMLCNNSRNNKNIIIWRGLINERILNAITKIKSICAYNASRNVVLIVIRITYALVSNCMRSWESSTPKTYQTQPNWKSFSGHS